MKLRIKGAYKLRAERRKLMKITLLTSYTDKASRIAEIDKQIAELDKKLGTPARTLDDIILHIELLKERNSLS